MFFINSLLLFCKKWNKIIITIISLNIRLNTLTSERFKGKKVKRKNNKGNKREKMIYEKRVTQDTLRRDNQVRATFHQERRRREEAKLGREGRVRVEETEETNKQQGAEG